MKLTCRDDPRGEKKTNVSMLHSVGRRGKQGITYGSPSVHGRSRVDVVPPIICERDVQVSQVFGFIGG